MSNAIVTISREYGSGGRLIAQKLAERLSIPLYDRQIISMTAKKSGLAEEYVEKSEQQGTSFLYTIATNWDGSSVATQLYLAEFDAIRELADKGPCVLLGRCANYVLEDYKNCINVFIYAPIEEKIRRAELEYGVKEKNMRHYIQKRDKARAAYYEHFASHTWGKAQNYDLCINSGMGIDLVVDLLESAYRHW